MDIASVISFFWLRPCVPQFPSIGLECSPLYHFSAVRMGTLSYIFDSDWFWCVGLSSSLEVPVTEVGQLFSYLIRLNIKLVLFKFNSYLSGSQSSRLKSNSLLSPISTFKINGAASFWSLDTQLTFSSDTVHHVHEPYSIISWSTLTFNLSFAGS